TKTRYISRRSPNAQLVAERPDAEMYFRTLDCRREFSQHARRQRQRVFKNQRLHRFFRRKIRERDLRKAAFFRTKAGPERGVDDAGDRARIRFRREIRFAVLARLFEMAHEMLFDDGRRNRRRLVSWVFLHLVYLPVKSVFSSTKQSPLPHGS